MKTVHGLGAHGSRTSWLLMGLTIVLMVALCGSAWAVTTPTPPRGAGIEDTKAAHAVALKAQPVETRVPGRMDHVPPGMLGQAGPWIAPRQDRSHLDDPPIVWVDDSYTGSESGYGTTLFNTIQGGIDAVAVGGMVNVYPGTYNEIAAGRYLYDASGPYQFGLFVGQAKGGITIRGVDASGNPITNYASVSAEVIYTATNGFGFSGIFVEGDNVTINGLWVHNAASQVVEKTFEITGDAFTMHYCKIDDWDLTDAYGGTVYFGDWRFNTTLQQSHIQTYTVTDNYFPRNNIIEVANGTGYGWPASGRVISGNTFDSYGQVYAAISFMGTVPAYGWYAYPVSGATISGNTFVNGTLQYIKSRGVYNNATFDWASYWNDNTFDKKVVHGSSLPGGVAEYSYSVYDHTRRIAAVIGDEIYYATNNDVVLAGAGNYVENLVIDKSITLNGAGEASTKIYPAVSGPGGDGGPSFSGSQVIVVQASNVTISNLTVDGDNTSLTSGVIRGGADIDARNGITEGDPGPFDGTIVHDCTVKNIYLRGIYARSGGSGFNFHHNTVQNVAGGPSTVSMFNYGGSGTFAYNTVTNVSDGIASNHSRGTLYEHNVVTNSHGYGIHTDNNGDAVGSTADEIRFNTVSGASNCWGIMIFFPYLNATAHDNTVSGTYIGLAAWGGSPLGLATFSHNTVSGTSLIGAFVTPGEDNWASWQGNVVASLTGNSISNCPYGFYAETDESNPSDFTATVSAHGNSISGSTRAAVQDGGSPWTLDASGNWWGPAPVWGSILLGSIDYTPWCQLDGTYDNPGFTPNMSQLKVEAASPQTGLVGRIQEGINMTVGSTVNVSAGTYNEAVVVNKSVTLLGAKAGLLAKTRSGTESIVDPNSSAAHGFDVQASDVTIDGFTITNSAAYPGSGERYGVVTLTKIGGGRFNNVAVRNNIIRRQFKGVDFNFTDNFEISGNWIHGESASYNYGCTWVDDYGTYCNTGLITNNDLDGYGSAVEIQGDGTHPVSNVTISNNRSTGSQYALFGLQSSVITNNTVLNVTGGTHVYVGGGCSNVTVTGNHFDVGSSNGMSINDAFGAGINSGFVVHNNSFTGHTNPGFFEMKVSAGAYSGTLDATCNWWGSLNNATILGKTQGSVTFDPWNDATLANCTYTDANTYDFTLSFDDAYVGCAGGASCTDAILKVAFDRAGFRAGHLVITLPPGIVTNFPSNPNYDGRTLIPGGQVSTNQTWCTANISGSTIVLDVAWGNPVNPNNEFTSTGAPNQYIAWLPVRNSSATSGTYPIAISSYDYRTPDGTQYTSGFDFSLPSIYVDCVAPVGTALTGGAGETPCLGYNDALAFTDAMSIVVGTSVSPLTSAVVSLNGGVHTYNIPLVDGTWPPAAGGVATTVWGDMMQGCNLFTLTVTDAACNAGTTSAVSVIKDTQGPAFNPTSYFTQGTPCYNDISTDPNYGATRLDVGLNMNVNAPGSCETGGYTLAFTMGANSLTPIAGAAISGYPDAGQATALWNFITPNITLLHGANYSGSVQVDWSLKDCLGNETTGNFTFCVDFAPPENSFTMFDARPTSDGVWLKWAWGTTDAVEAKIFRKGEGTYPVYGGNLSMHDGNYEKVESVAAAVANGWVEVAPSLTGGVSSTNYHGGSDIHNALHPEYWKDAVNSPRDIYRYITFVKDAAGNWSNVEATLPNTYTIGINADRSTNYWLGDFVSPNGPGIVTSPDLTELSGGYFQAVPPAHDYLDIGPENHENGYGKGIPDPDQFIDFSDLVPFSFNFGVVSDGGYLITPPSKPFASLDNVPVVSAAQTSEGAITLGSTFTVTFSLNGNDHSVKAIETQVKFDPEVIALVSATPGSFEVSNGIPWSTAKAVAGETGKIVMAAAAMGETAIINEGGTLATVEFRWISKHAAHTNIELTSVKMSDGAGANVSGVGSTMSVGAEGILPTAYALFQNYPNPFNPTTTINFDLKENGFVKLSVYNVLGQQVATLVNNTMEAGHQSVSFNASNLSSGLYIYKIEVNGFTALHKMMLMR